jgi:hypothetical protein
LPSSEVLIFPSFGRLPNQEDFPVCPDCGSKRRLILRGECSHCFIDNKPCPDWRIGKFSVFIIFSCDHRVLVCHDCPRLKLI